MDERRGDSGGRREGDDDVGLDDRVHALKGQVAALAGNIELLTEKLDGLVTSTELEERVRSQGRRLVALIVGAAVSVVVMAGGFYAAGAYAQRTATAKVRSEARQRVINLCDDNNRRAKVIRDIVDRSLVSQRLDTSKLSPDTRKVLAEYAAAQPPQEDPQSFRSFVYAATAPQDCSKLPRP